MSMSTVNSVGAAFLSLPIHEECFRATELIYGHLTLAVLMSSADIVILELIFELCEIDRHILPL